MLLGVLSANLDYPDNDWLEVIEALVPPKTREINRKAFAAGRAWAFSAREAAGPRFDVKSGRRHGVPQQPGFSVSLEINPAWCKGCDICVKLCPERCLALDAQQVAVVTDPKACTGCHVCEWLCPDFAITVKTTVQDAVNA